MDQGGAVIHLTLYSHGQTEGGQHIQRTGGLQHGGKGILRTLKQGVLEKQVAAGGACHAQFGQHKDPHPLICALAHEGEDLFRIMTAVGHTDLRCACCGFDESVTHFGSPQG